MRGVRKGNEMIQRYVAPREYLHGPGAIKAAGERISPLGKRVALLGGRRALHVAQEHGLEESLTASGLLVEVSAPFEGHCTTRLIERYREAAAASRAEVIVGVGGGSAVDCAKAVAAALNLPVATIPTSAAQCAPTSPISILYTDEGAWKGSLRLPASPEVVIVDDDVVAAAPVRFLRAGIADALAKPYEVRLAVASGMGDALVRAALAVANAILEELRTKAEPAVRLLEARQGEGSLARQNAGDQLLGDVIDACIFLPGMVSGAAGDQARLSVAHAVHNALTRFESVRKLYHGEIVAYGIAVQLSLEGRIDEAEEFAHLMRRIGVVANLEALGLNSAPGLEAATGQVLQHLVGLKAPFDSSPEAVRAALLEADGILRDGQRQSS